MRVCIRILAKWVVVVGGGGGGMRQDGIWRAGDKVNKMLKHSNWKGQIEAIKLDLIEVQCMSMISEAFLQSPCSGMDCNCKSNADVTCLH